MHKWLYGFFIIFVLAFLLFWKRPKTVAPIETDSQTTAEVPEPAPSPEKPPLKVSAKTALVSKSTPPAAAVSMNVEGKTITVPASSPRPHETTANLHAFTVEDGVAVIDGDIVLGVPSQSAHEGVAEMPAMELWPTREIPYFIQPSLSNPGRVLDAFKYFAPTFVSFVPYTDQDDVLVFQEGTGSCKSYVGRTGGKQPLWLAPACGPHEIAHEIMHALGFTHEQNRTDRDRYIRLNRENIDPAKMTNFEKMPQEFMQISGLADFSFNSIMIYPPTMFSKTGRPTMEPVSPGEQIAPSQELSNEDITRVNKIYGAR